MIQTSPQTQSSLQSNPAQPYGIPSTTATIQPQLSALPPTATTFPPSVLPPVNSLQPYGTTGGLGYPSTIGGQYGLGAAGSAAGVAPTSVSTSSQLVSPWFPSLPASYCGGTFLLTIEGTPRGDGDKNNKIEPSENNDRKGNNGGGNNDDDDSDHHKNSKDSERERRLLSLQVNSDNSRIFTDDDGYLVRSSRVRIISIRTKVTISISNQSLTIARLLHSARDNVEHLFNITELQLIPMFSF